MFTTLPPRFQNSQDIMSLQVRPGVHLNTRRRLMTGYNWLHFSNQNQSLITQVKTDL